MPVKTPHACGAKTRSGKSCKQIAMQNGRCKMHGGKSLKGIASPTFKDGKHSKYIAAIPGRIKKDFEQLRERDDLLRLNDDIALIDTRILDVLRRVDAGDGAIWKEIEKAHRAYLAARKSGDDDLIEQRITELSAVIERGVTDYQAWAEVKSLIEQRRRLVESERKRELEEQEVLTAREAAALFNALLSIIVEHVTDPSTRQRIQTAVTGLIASEHRARLAAVG